MYAAEGEYAINGRPCRDYRYEDFRRQVTLLSQKTCLQRLHPRQSHHVLRYGAAGRGADKDACGCRAFKWYAERGASMDTRRSAARHALSAAKSAGSTWPGRSGAREASSCWTNRGGWPLTKKTTRRAGKADRAAALRYSDRRHAQLFPGVFGQLHQGAPASGTEKSLCKLIALRFD